MPRKKPRRRHALVGLVGVLLLAGCIGLPTGGPADADSVGESVQNRYDAIERYSATVTRTVETSSGTASASARLTVDTDDRMRVAYEAGPRAGTVETIDLSSDRNAGPVLSTSLQRANDGRAVSYGALASTLVRTNNVTLERTAVIDGRSTAVVSLVPHDAENGSASVERRLWIDTERRIPVRIETTWSDGDESVTETVRYTNVTITERSDSSVNGGETA
jgi:outer membrane lipoprotein-sorting protein